MKFKTMYAEMLYSYRKLMFSFLYSGGVTLVISKNLDQKTANGGGKTSLLKILYFLIYGADLKKAVKADIPNRSGNGSYYGYLDIEDSGHELRIERFAKRKDLHPHKIDKECLNFYVDGKLLMGAATENTVEEVQEVIINRLRLSPRLFLSSVLTQQTSPKGNSVPFLIANDTQKKEILAEILDLTSYVRAHEATKKEISSIEDRRKEKQNRVDSLKEQIELLKEQIKEQEILFANFDTEKNKEVEKEEQNIKVERSKVISLRKTLKKTENIEDLTDQLKTISDKIKVLEENLKDEVSLVKSLTEKQASLEQNNKSLNEVILKNKELIAEINKDFIHNINVNNYDLLSVEDFKVIKINDLNSVSSYISKIELDKKDLVEKINTETDLKNKLSDKVEELNSKEKEINQVIFSINNLDKQISELESTDRCPTCERDFDEKHRQEHIVPKIDESKKELELLHTKRDVLIKEKEEIINKFVNELKSELAIIEDLKNKNNQYSQLINYLKVVKNEHEVFISNKDKMNIDITKSKEDESSLQGKADELIKLITPLQKKVDDIAPFKVELLSLQKSKNDLETLINKTREAITDNKRTQDKIDLIINNGKVLVENLKKTKEKTNPHQDIIKNNNTKIGSIEETINKFNKSISDDDDELKYLKFWLLGFSPTGIRSFIADDLIEILNQKVASHLDDLFDGALSVLFEPESENNKGVSINKIETKYFLNGKEVSEESLSGGQIQRCILATDLALTEVAESRSGIKLNVKFLDEPFTGMDSAGQQQAFRLFNKLAKEKDGFFVISHDENFQSLCANTVHIVYKNENSEIVSKAEFDKYALGEEQDLNENIFESKKDTNFAEYLREVALKKQK